MKRAYQLLIALFCVFFVWGLVTIFLIPRDTLMLLSIKESDTGRPELECTVNSYQLEKFITQIEEHSNTQITLASDVDTQLHIDFQGSSIPSWQELLKQALAPYQLAVEQTSATDRSFLVRPVDQ